MKNFPHFKMAILFVLALLVGGAFVYVVQQEVKHQSQKRGFNSTQIGKYYPRVSEQKGATGASIILDKEDKQKKKVTSETISLSEGIWEVVSTENKSFETLHELYYFENESDQEGELVDLFTVRTCDSFAWEQNDNDEITVVYTTSPCEAFVVKNKRVYSAQGKFLYETIHNSSASSLEFAVGEQKKQEVELLFSEGCESRPDRFEYPRLELLPTTVLEGIEISDGENSVEYKLDEGIEVECAVFYGDQIVDPFISEPVINNTERVQILLPGGIWATLELLEGAVNTVEFELMGEMESFSERTVINRSEVTSFIPELPEPCEFEKIKQLNFSARDMSETVRYRNEEQGIQMQIPYNAIWGYPIYRLNPYDQIENKLVYGTINVQGEGCGAWIQGTESITFLPAERKETVLDRLRKESEALEFGYSIEEYTIDGKEVVNYIKDGMCGGGGTIVIGEKANYELATFCSSNLDVELIESMEFIQ